MIMIMQFYIKVLKVVDYFNLEQVINIKQQMELIDIFK
jgi:hypothetical protein